MTTTKRQRRKAKEIEDARDRLAYCARVYAMSLLNGSVVEDGIDLAERTTGAVPDGTAAATKHAADTIRLARDDLDNAALDYACAIDEGE